MSLEFVQICMQIKETRRAGWIRRGIKDGESVADHTFGVLLLILQATENLPAETRLKALEMAIAHDLPEAIIGDYTPADHVSKERKRTEEGLAMDFLQCLAPSPTETLRARLAEYNEHQTPISRLVHQADKLESLIQALRYSKMFPEARDLEDFKAHIKYIENLTLASIGKGGLEQWDLSRPKVQYIFLIGGPGVGKGTQCKRLAQEYTACFSLGELLRQEANNEKSPFQAFIKRSFEESVSVPGELAMWILRDHIEAAANAGKSLVVLDGFPRSLQQLKAFMTEISLDFGTVYLSCPVGILSERLEARARLSNRPDDLDARIRTLRVQEFEASSLALLAELRHHPFREIDGSRTEDDIASNLRICLQELRSEMRTKI
ncbi:uncharacterized protein F4812DRAFT_463898 [Daldinia caldariorum]|uniref:uncharacterized protein n=1 Tax=Daldinia caldariorum TaxID=326644 RepID=UPI00200840F4|nr:uncharacterized protein F4812DRAFT_463898 [Daldinia caldariorum]KAI1463206.1 hypothetical protein F4812DRAFT_463898 [Daldinia caldariorum]